MDSRQRAYFSFGRHYDPAKTGFGLLLVNNDDVVAAGGGFPSHSHRDMEIATWVLDGELAHADSTGLRRHDLNAIPGGELMTWAVVYRGDGKDHLAWQDTLGILWFTERPDQHGRRQDPRVEDASRRAVRVTESRTSSPTGGLVPIMPSFSPVLAR